MTRIYRYILTHDVGMAPCPENDLITLGTCKPVIRRVARAGDWVLGFRPGSLVRGLVLWAGKVERSMTHGEYHRAYPGRSDAVYHLASNGQYERLVPDYHPTQMEMDRDTREPVLLFDPQHSYYLNGIPAQLPEDLAHLAAAGRGHRVAEPLPALEDRLRDWLESLDQARLAVSQPKNSRLHACGLSPRTKGC